MVCLLLVYGLFYALDITLYSTSLTVLGYCYTDRSLQL